MQGGTDEEAGGGDSVTDPVNSPQPSEGDAEDQSCCASWRTSQCAQTQVLVGPCHARRSMRMRETVHMQQVKHRPGSFSSIFYALQTLTGMSPLSTLAATMPAKLTASLAEPYCGA